MSYCIKPGCKQAQNENNSLFCTSCGSKLLLRERYRPIQPLGKGGFGRTFLAIDEHMPDAPRCVVKQFSFITENAESFKKAVELFRQEAVHLNQLGKHPQIPYLLGHFEQDKLLYMVQEFIEGQTLSQELAQGALTEDRIWALLQNLLPVLKFIHQHKVIHRDIKPANIIRRNSDDKLVLIDFGVAKLLTSSGMGRKGTVIGSQYYAAPEQVQGKAVIASDLYSLGVTCIRMLTRAKIGDIYDAKEQQWWWRYHLVQGKKITSQLAEILDKLVQHKVSDRYQSADEVLQAIKSIRATETTVFPDNVQYHQAKADELRYINSSLEPSQLRFDYANFQHLLTAQKWKDADQESWRLMCQALGKPTGTYIQVSDLDQFPCQELLLIDQLWVTSSHGRYGFSVQKQIFDRVKGDYVSFCKQVNWPICSATSYYQKLLFSHVAPVGHLPSRIWVAGLGWLHHAEAMAARLEQCITSSP